MNLVFPGRQIANGTARKTDMSKISIRRQVARMGLALGLLLTCLLPLTGGQPPAEKDAAAQPSQAPRRWAIISADAKSGALADLLTAQLSRWKQVELLEREQIAKVLSELQLNASGLVAPDQAARFGQLSR